MANSRDNRTRLDHTRQTTIRLFEDQDREQRDLVAQVGRTTLRDGAWATSLLPSYTSQLFVTSPTTTRITPVPPNAPIKPRKPFSKEGLKPKKLRFTDKEEDENCILKNANFLIKTSKAECSKQQNESSGTLDRDSLSALLQSVRLKLDNKENGEDNRRYGQGRYEKRTRNNRSVAKERAKNNNDSSQSSKLNYSPKDFEKCSIELSPCNNAWSKEEKLLWLQPRRDVGMWIQCCRKNCKKWRFCDDFHDPVNVPRIWYCEMNSNKSIAYCYVPEVPITKEIEEDLIENKYNAGSLVWGLIDDHTWWPAMVDDCPKTVRFYELKELSIIPIKYHVIFFKEDIQCAWLNLKNIKPFIKYKRNTLVRKLNGFDENYKNKLKKAYALAQSASLLSIFERLQKFSYISRLRDMQKSAHQSYEEQDDEIPSTPTKRITLKEFYLKNKTL